MSQNHKHPSQESDAEQSVKRPQHESGEPIAQRGEHAPRSVGKQAHRDLERGLEDTDRRGSDDHQRRTQGEAPSHDKGQ